MRGRTREQLMVERSRCADRPPAGPSARGTGEAATAPPGGHQTFALSLVVITWNEAHHIARCLDSVPFAAEKIVVDSGSSDETVAVARRCGARVVVQDWLGFGAQRNFATRQARHDWILVLDADEYLTQPLIEEMSRRLPQLLGSSMAGAVLRRSAWFMGAPMRWYRPMVGERKARLYHRNRARWTDVPVHESLKFDGPSVTFQAPFLHDHYPSVLHGQLKYLRYAELRSQQWAANGRPSRIWASPFVYLFTFLKDYLLRLAVLDGWRGYTAAHLAASHSAYKRIRHHELLVNPESEESAGNLLERHRMWR